MDDDRIPVDILLGCSGYEPSYMINGQNYQLAILAIRAHFDSGLTADAWNLLSDAERGALIDAQIEKIRAETATKEQA